MNSNIHENWKLFKNQFLFDFFALKEIKKIFKTKKLNPMKKADDMEKYSKHHQSIGKNSRFNVCAKKATIFFKSLHNLWCFLHHHEQNIHMTLPNNRLSASCKSGTKHPHCVYINLIYSLFDKRAFTEYTIQWCKSAMYMRVTPFVYYQSLSRLFHI